MRQLKITKSITNRESASLDKYLQEIGKEELITVEEEDGAVDFYELRRAKENPKVDWKRKLGLLWRQELAHIQAKNMLPRYPGKSRRFVVQKLLERVPPEILRPQISEELFERDYSRYQAE